MEELKIKTLYNLQQTVAKDLLIKNEYPWECLNQIKDYILELGAQLDLNKFNKIGDNIWIAKSARIDNNTKILGPTIIDENVEIRHCAFIREGVIIGKNSIIGNSTELKNCILFNNVQLPHYNYVGDSILGYRVHMGAGSIISNFKLDEANIIIKYKEKKIETGLRKFGAMIGDNSNIGCNAVLNPGTILGKEVVIYPLSNIKGVISGKIDKKDNIK